MSANRHSCISHNRSFCLKSPPVEIFLSEVVHLHIYHVTAILSYFGACFASNACVFLILSSSSPDGWKSQNKRGADLHVYDGV